MWYALWGATESNAILVASEHSIPTEARLIAGLSRRALARAENRGREVLVMFENGDPKKPIIVGVLADTLEELITLEVREHSPVS